MWTFLIAAARMLALDSVWCEPAAAVVRHYAESVVPFVVTEPLLDAAMAGDDVVVVSGVSPSRRLVRTSPRLGTEVLMPPTERQGIGGEYLHARAGRWWYAVAGQRGGVKGTYFVTDDGTATTVPLSGLFLTNWLPLKTDAPRVLELSTAEDGSALATDVHADGPLRSWRLPLPPGRLSSAELLPDGRIALVTHHKDSGRLTLLLLGDEDRIDIYALGYKMLIQLATAVDASGRIAIATATGDQRVDGTIIVPGRPGDPQWRQLRRGIRQMAWSGELQMVAVKEGFVAAWINRNETLRLETANLSADYANPPVLAIGTLLDQGINTFYSLRAEEGEPVFTWDDGSRIVTRRLPASISGYVLSEAIAAHCRH